MENGAKKKAGSVRVCLFLCDRKEGRNYRINSLDEIVPKRKRNRSPLSSNVSVRVISRENYCVPVGCGGVSFVAVFACMFVFSRFIYSSLKGSIFFIKSIWQGLFH